MLKLSCKRGTTGLVLRHFRSIFPIVLTWLDMLFISWVRKGRLCWWLSTKLSKNRAFGSRFFFVGSFHVVVSPDRLPPCLAITMILCVLLSVSASRSSQAKLRIDTFTRRFTSPYVPFSFAHVWLTSEYFSRGTVTKWSRIF